MTLPENWTAAKLVAELKDLGMVLPVSTQHKTLMRVYKQLKTTNTADDASINRPVSGNSTQQSREVQNGGVPSTSVPRDERDQDGGVFTSIPDDDTRQNCADCNVFSSMSE